MSSMFKLSRIRPQIWSCAFFAYKLSTIPTHLVEVEVWIRDPSIPFPSHWRQERRPAPRPTRHRKRHPSDVFFVTDVSSTISKFGGTKHISESSWLFLLFFASVVSNIFQTRVIKRFLHRFPSVPCAKIVGWWSRQVQTRPRAPRKTAEFPL